MSQEFNSPLVSFVVTFYNQERFVESALKSVLDQTYQPLEIIIADDHSTDGTETKIRQVVDAYKRSKGPHKVFYRRNEKNLGMLCNFESAFLQAKGELIVAGGGDDISCPNRVAKIIEAWLAVGKKPTVVFHRVKFIDFEGRSMNRVSGDYTLRHPLGAAMAYSPIVVKSFASVQNALGYEDSVFGRRAYAFGDPLYLPDCLVDYRVGSGDSTAGVERERRCRISKAMLNAARQNLIDLATVKGQIPECREREIRVMAESLIRQYSVEYRMLTASWFWQRLVAFFEYAKIPGGWVRPNLTGVIFHYLPIIFPICSKPIYWLYHLIKNERK